MGDAAETIEMEDPENEISLEIGFNKSDKRGPDPCLVRGRLGNFWLKVNGVLYSELDS